MALGSLSDAPHGRWRWGVPLVGIFYCLLLHGCLGERRAGREGEKKEKRGK